MRTAIIILTILAGCSTGSSEKKGNHRAIILHNSLTRKANLIQRRLSELKSDSSVNKDSVQQLSEALEQWRSELIEVPGNKDHDHHDHVHSHKEIHDVTEEQVLAIQRDLDERLSSIGTRIFNLKPELNDVDHEH